MLLSLSHIREFQKLVRSFYRQGGRHTLPWRKITDPYKILVSELMLQQTQVDRVIAKYTVFIKRFPTLKKVSTSTQSDVLRAWQGLGYNRRALFLHRLAQTTSRLPTDYAGLINLPGIGSYTAAAIQAFAFNQPVTLIETNVRTVFLHHFFQDAQQVSDSQLLPLITQTIDRKNPRAWYWALMDYGSYLKKSVGNANVRSKHYTKQSRFAGSNRQLRGHILRELLKGQKTEAVLLKRTGGQKIRLREMLTALVKEQFIVRKRRGANTVYMLR